MKNIPVFFVLLIFSIVISSCNNDTKTEEPVKKDSTGTNIGSPTDQTDSYDTSFIVEAESFADLQLLRYQVPGFKKLSLSQKQLAYYL